MPFNLINEASIDDLNSRLTDCKVSERNFRPNFVLVGAQPYAEDNWKFVKIGENVFEIIKPCTRWDTQMEWKKKVKDQTILSCIFGQIAGAYWRLSIQKPEFATPKQNHWRLWKGTYFNPVKLDNIHYILIHLPCIGCEMWIRTLSCLHAPNIGRYIIPNTNLIILFSPILATAKSKTLNSAGQRATLRAWAYKWRCAVDQAALSRLTILFTLHRWADIFLI